MVYAFFSPDLCSLPAGAKSPKESDKKEKKKYMEKGKEIKKAIKGLGEILT